MKLPTRFWVTTTLLLAIVCLMELALILRSQPPQKFTSRGNLTQLDVNGLAQRAEKILSDTKAKVVVLWSTDLDVNARTVLYVHDTRGAVSELIGYTDQIYTNDLNINILMAQLMTSKFKCGQINTKSKVGQYVASVGAPSICRRGIVRNGVLIGYISLSYPVEPQAKDIALIENYVDSLLTDVVRKTDNK